ncbi:MAG TPA: metalloregulator ArsR/SmtB family transcription factor [Defluviitaleaceae bacterium]|jgi:ArsR family transcriptional regulator|nr:helix-turn-helix transcriptional regulator [Candidatus Epulonipiscium sp.]HOA80111.1 metalloregulator ArsR/SmtB family transcription factor [Defluviitaleaceae bacterium]
MNIKEFEKKAEILKALGHPARLCIVKGLLDNDGCNVSYMQICIGLPQSTVSQHISRLKSAGIIEGVRSGLEITYKVIDKDAIEIINAIFK